MLLKDLIHKLTTFYPKTYDTLTLGQLTTFATLSADLLNRTQNGKGYKMLQIKAPVEFI
ncbi:hypothetical protein DFH28DRAFT_892648 [Melampsora americana]|nr:hypothetical protein DFH28DRAFT_892648 [Melampsora americana]